MDKTYNEKYENNQIRYRGTFGNLNSIENINNNIKKNNNENLIYSPSSNEYNNMSHKIINNIMKEPENRKNFDEYYSSDNDNYNRFYSNNFNNNPQNHENINEDYFNNINYNQYTNRTKTMRSKSSTKKNIQIFTEEEVKEPEEDLEDNENEANYQNKESNFYLEENLYKSYGNNNKRVLSNSTIHTTRKKNMNHPLRRNHSEIFIPSSYKNRNSIKKKANPSKLNDDFFFSSTTNKEIIDQINLIKESSTTKNKIDTLKEEINTELDLGKKSNLDIYTNSNMIQRFYCLKNSFRQNNRNNKLNNYDLTMTTTNRMSTLNRFKELSKNLGKVEKELFVDDLARNIRKKNTIVNNDGRKMPLGINQKINGLKSGLNLVRNKNYSNKPILFNTYSQIKKRIVMPANEIHF